MGIIEKIKHIVDYSKEYGIQCCMSVMPYNIMTHFDKNINKKHYSAILLSRKHNSILKYLYKRYYYFLRSYKPHLHKTTHEYKNCIWTAWLQGEENAPDIIRVTIASMRRNANGHRVMVLTYNNIDHFIDIPESIKQKHKAGILEKAHYADVVRMMILAKYGGLWLDATMLLHEPIDECAFLSEFYSIGLDERYSCFISNNRWKVNVLGGKENSKYLNEISDLLNKYWIEHNVSIDYFIFDYIIAFIYENDMKFKKIVDLLPKSKYPTHKLKTIINDEYDETILYNLLRKDQVYLLSYRNQYSKWTASGKRTYYGYLFTDLLGGNEKNNSK